MADAPVQPGVGEQHVQAGRVQQGVQAVEEFDEPGVAQVVEEDAHRPGALFAEAAGGGVRPVAQLPYGRQDGVPLLGAHLAGTAQHQRDQRLRHSGPFGHVTDRRRFHDLDRSMKQVELSKG